MKKVFLGLIFLVVAGVIATIAFWMPQNLLLNIKFVIENNDCEQTLRLIEKEGGTYALYLPSYSKVEDVSLRYSEDFVVSINNKTIKNGCSWNNIELEKAYSIIIKPKFGLVKQKGKIIVYKTKDVNTLDIQLTNGKLSDIHESLYAERKGKITAIASDGKCDYSGEFKSMSGRGNSTWFQDKKPYSIHFEEDVKIFDMKKGKKWVLVSNSMDPSNLRNKIVYATAKEIGMKYTPELKYVDLYVDGEYLGLYLFAEKICVDDNRVDLAELEKNTQNINEKKLSTYSEFNIENDEKFMRGYNIPNDPSDVSGGYLMQTTLWGRGKMWRNAFSTPSKVVMSVDYPKCISKKQMEYISGVFDDIEQNLSNAQIEKYIDIQSWAEYYLMQEIFGNTEDASYYYYKDSDRIDSRVFAGPIWDFDIAVGNSYGWSWNNDKANPEAFYVATSGWYKQLYDNTVFYDEVKSLYKKKVRNKILKTYTEELDNASDMIASSYIMDKKRWGNLDEDIIPITDYKNEIDDYLSQRIHFFDEVWINNKKMVSVAAFSDVGKPLRIYKSTLQNEQIPELPILQEEGYEFEGWINEVTNEIYDEQEVLDTNKKYIAKWTEKK